MKRIWITALSAAAALMLSGMVAGAQETAYKIGICQQVQHPSLDLATQGFCDALTEKYGDKVTFDVQNASGDSGNCVLIINDFIAEDVDLILANATTALQAAASGTDKIPVLGTSVTDYASALDLDGWDGTVGSNVSGTSDCAPLAEQAKMIMELVPEAKTVGFLYCSAEPNSKYQADVMEAALQEDGCTAEIRRYTFIDSNDIGTVTASAVQKCDVIFIPTDNTAASNAEIINNVCEPAGVPVICGEESTCEVCGIATLTISYYDLGYQTGQMAADIFENGADISAMPVQYAEHVTKKYAKERTEALGIAVPDGYEPLGND